MDWLVRHSSVNACGSSLGRGGVQGVWLIPQKDRLRLRRRPQDELVKFRNPNQSTTNNPANVSVRTHHSLMNNCIKIMSANPFKANASFTNRVALRETLRNTCRGTSQNIKNRMTAT